MLPPLRSKNATKIINLSGFGGLNTSVSHKTNEITAGVNMSSELYPSLCSAKSEAVFKSIDGKGLGGEYFNGLYTVERTDAQTGNIYLCNDNTRVSVGEYTSLEDTENPRTLAFLKNEILIVPDNVIYNTNSDTVKKGCVSHKVTNSVAQKKFETESQTAEDMPQPYNIWYSCYITHNSIVSMSDGYRVSSSSYKFYNLGLSEEFEIGDVVTVKMDVKPIDASQDSAYKQYTKKMSAGISLKIKDMEKTTHNTPSGSVTEYTKLIFEDNSIDMGGYDEVFVFGITIEKGIPNFVDICSYENRIWGVTTDKIHASKLGDSSEWNDFSVDSYGTLPTSSFASEVETDGEFTAVTSFNGNIIAFKEDCIHKIYGNTPAEYSISKINCPGVAKDCNHTLAIVGGTVYYMGKKGVYAFNGSVARLVSSNVLPSMYTAHEAAGDERYYYLAVSSEEGEHIYIYDTHHGIWHKTETEQTVKALLKCPDGVYAVSDDYVKIIGKEIPGSWHFVLNLGTQEFASKHLCSLYLRYTLGENGEFELRVENAHGTYVRARADTKANNKVLKVRIPVSCAYDAKIIFNGKGEFALNSVEIGYRETGIYDN